MTLAERLLAHVSPEPNTGCWLFVASDKNRYPRMRMGAGRQESVHRISWELSRGPVPDGLSVCHRCDVPPCVNPAHLFLGTQADNVHDMIRKGRANHPPPPSHKHRARGEAHGSAKLSAAQVRAIHDAVLLSGERSSRVAARYSVSPTLVCRIAAEKIWRHLWSAS